MRSVASNFLRPLALLGGFAVCHPAHSAGAVPQMPVATDSYRCDGGKTLTAAYFDGAVKPPARQGQPPTPGGSVELTLGDGRTITLPQTLSGSGVRYANRDESVVFWSVGKGALLVESGAATYDHCMMEKKAAE
ncbi:MliC family protein [Nitratireductor sp. XY-223]|uniref:MliC family protein n=1 Tax=Nitratireductor sp. XY-223 TaxID=2561926 RepID=UPI0010AA32C7|nr:MliC family protein [Nitratireductor sp. XY-223]